MENNYLLTVIVPVFNTERYVERCLNSIINQSLKNIKIVVIDDKSTDSSYEKILNYEKYDNILILQNPHNMGQGLTRNLGLQYIDTKYYCFLDSDDWVDTNAYKKAIDALEKNDDCNIAIFGIKTEYENTILSTIRYAYEDNIISSDFALGLLARENAQDTYISALLGNKIFRSSAFSGISFNCRYFEDAIYTYKVLFLADRVLLVSDVFFHYYQRAGSIMHCFSKKYIDDLLDEFLELYEYLRTTNSITNLKQYYAFFDKCCNSMFNQLFSNEQDVCIQKEYLAYFFNSIGEKMNILELIKYLDINRFKKILFI